MLKKLQALVIALALLVLNSPVHAQSQSPLPFPKESIVASALAAMYAPSGGNDETFWVATICSEMSEGGCGYFKSQLESMLWQKGQQTIIAGSSANFVTMTAHLEDGSQVWKMTVTIFEQGKSLTSDVYVQVVYDQAQRQWLLNRVLYSPYINL